MIRRQPERAGHGIAVPSRPPEAATGGLPQP